MKTKRWVCIECDHITDSNYLLQATNPFDPDDVIYGCPNCKSVDKFELVCDEPGCNRSATNGFPTKTGYRNTCGLHAGWSQK